MDPFDVVVVGAGPVGLMLACELGLQKVRVLVVERLPQPDPTIKAGSITTPTAEAFERRGLLPAIASVQDQALAMMAGFRPARAPVAGDPDSPLSRRRLPAGHFAGLWNLDASRLDPADPDYPVGAAAAVTMVNQQAVEWILAARAAELGVEVRRRAEFTGYTDDNDGVVVDVDGERVHAGWLVGCDGGRSLVRRLGEFEFPGTDPTITGHQALVDLVDPEKLPSGWNRTSTGMMVHGPVPGRILTVEYDGPPADRDTPVTLEELQASLRNVSGTDVTIRSVATATRFTDNARQATTYRLGRVLLAGDAAHVHSPFGGQGLNLGVGDAVNLGWKLAASVHGTAPKGLIDTYTSERHPIGAWVLDWTRAQVALMRPDPQTGALRDIVADLMGTDDGNTYFIKKISGVAVRLDLGSDDERVGKRMPNLELSDGTSLAEHSVDGRPILWAFQDDPVLRERAAGWSERVDVIALTCPSRPDIAATLVRPDGVVAWICDRGASSEGLEAALSRWFGAPLPVTSTR